MVVLNFQLRFVDAIELTIPNTTQVILYYPFYTQIYSSLNLHVFNTLHDLVFKVYSMGSGSVSEEEPSDVIK